MPVNQALLALLMARSVVDRVSQRYSVLQADLRTLSAIHCLLTMGKPATIAGVTELLGLTVDFNTHHGLTRLRSSGLVHNTGKAGNSILLGLSALGLRLVGLLEREERDARRRVQSVVLTRKKRAYVKSGKFVGKAARQANKKKDKDE